jgi:glycosyltransferase involved in cell wall biosynthesis
MKNPILSVCIPTYSRGGFAKEAAELLLAAWPGDEVEVVVSDNCSEDDTEALMKTIRDPRLSYYRNESNLGAAFNTHLTFMKAKGAFAYLTSDEDDLLPDQIPFLLSYFQEHPETSIFIGGGDLKYTRKRFPDAVYKEPFEALKAVAFQTRYMTGLILNQRLYAEKIGHVTFEESPHVWDAYSFMYAMAHLCCYGEVVTSARLLFKQTRFTMTDASNNARKDGIYYYEPQGRINQMRVWINTFMELPVSDYEKQFLSVKIIYDTMLLAARIFTPGYIDEVRKTVPPRDFDVYSERVHSLDKEALCMQIVGEGKAWFAKAFGKPVEAIEDVELQQYYAMREREWKDSL